MYSTLNRRIEALADYIGPTGPDWMFERCRELRRGGVPFTEAMAQAKRELAERRKGHA
jgi:hypothetical protein